MADLTQDGTSSWSSGTADTKTTLTDGSTGSFMAAANVNGVAEFAVELQAILGAATALKGTQADLATRLAKLLTDGGALVQGTVFPSGPLSGQVFYRTDLVTVYVYDSAGAMWKPGFDDLTLARLDGTREYTGNIKIKKVTPAVRFKGTETSGRDVLLDEDAGIIQLLDNTGTESSPTWVERLRVDMLKPERNQFLPAGMITPYASSTAPTGFLPCDGAAVSRTTYADLFAVTGTTYGVGDGFTTFNVPDLRGRTVVMVDGAANRITSASTGGANADTLGGVGGAETHTLTASEMPAHLHSIVHGDTGSGTHEFNAGAFSNTTGIDTQTTSTGGGAAHSNTQPWIVLNYIVKT